MMSGRWMWKVGAISMAVMGLVGACSDDDGNDGNGEGGEAGHDAHGSGGADHMSGQHSGGTAGAQSAGATSGGTSAASGSGGAGGEGALAGGGAGGEGALAGGGAGGEGVAGADAGGGGAGGAAGPDPLVWKLGACTPRGLSKDGSTVLADEGVWTAASGWVALPDLPGGVASNQPRALSPNGKVVFGNSGSALGDETYRWTAAGGIQGLGKTYVPFSASLDGSVVVGWSNDNVDEDDFADPFLWTSSGGFTDLGSFDPSSSTTSFIDAHLNEAGTLAEFSYDRDRARWTVADGLDVVSSNLRVSAMSADGSKLATFYGHSGGYIGMTGGCIPEPNDPPLTSPACSATGGDIWVVILDMDDAGDRAVGFQLNDDNEYFAFYWTANAGIHRLDDVLPDGIKSYPNAEAEEWFADSYPPRPYLSGDGQTVLGKGANNQCFVAKITEPT